MSSMAAASRGVSHPAPVTATPRVHHGRISSRRYQLLRKKYLRVRRELKDVRREVNRGTLLYWQMYPGTRSTCFYLGDSSKETYAGLSQKNAFYPGIAWLNTTPTKWSRPSHAFRSLWPRSCRSPKLLWQVEMLLWPCPPQPSATRTLWTRRCSRLGCIRSPQRRQHLQRGLHGAASTREDAKREGIQKRVQAADFSAVADDAPTAQASSPAAGLDGMVTAAETWLRNLCGDVDAAAEKATHRRVRPSLALPLVYI